MYIKVQYNNRAILMIKRLISTMKIVRMKNPLE